MKRRKTGGKGGADPVSDDSAHDEKRVRESLPRAWDRLLYGPDERLVELIAAVTEEMCQVRPNRSVIATFLQSLDVKLRQRPAKTITLDDDPTGRCPLSFTFRGVEFKAEFWYDVLATLCSELYRLNETLFRELARKLSYLSNLPHERRQSKRVRGTEYYVETKLGAKETLKRCRVLLSKFGLPIGSVRITLRCGKQGQLLTRAVREMIDPAQFGSTGTSRRAKPGERGRVNPKWRRLADLIRTGQSGSVPEWGGVPPDEH